MDVTDFPEENKNHKKQKEKKKKKNKNKPYSLNNQLSTILLPIFKYPDTPSQNTLPHHHKWSGTGIPQPLSLTLWPLPCMHPFAETPGMFAVPWAIVCMSSQQFPHLLF
jgi:hypothetical protein